MQTGSYHQLYHTFCGSGGIIVPICPTPALPQVNDYSFWKHYKEPKMEEMQGMLKLLADDSRRREDEIATEKA